MSLRSMLGTATALLALSAAMALPAPARAGVLTGSSGWAWLSPSPTGGGISAIAVAGGRGYAYGVSGELLHTDDAGRSWTGLPSARNPPGLPAVAGPDTVIVPLQDCALRRSDDGGRSFRRLRVVPSGTVCPAQILGVAAPSPAEIRVALTTGVLYSSNNGGATFARTGPIAPPGAPPGQLRELVFASPEIGFAIKPTPGGTQILRTTDGGVSWAQVALTRGALADLELAGAAVAYAVGGPGLVLRSTDGGATWARRPLAGLDPTRSVDSATCPSPATCLFETVAAQGGDPETLRTTDGAATAAMVPLLKGAFGALAAFSERRVAYLGARQAISDDAGATFTFLAPVTVGADMELTRTGRSSAVSFGSGGSLFRTADAGRTWRSIGLPDGRSAIDAWFPTAAVGYALGPRGGFIRTANAGIDWQELPSLPGATRVYAPDARRVFVFGRWGIQRSSDGGKTFRAVGARAVRGAPLEDFDLAGRAMFATGAQTIVRSLDRGRTWRRLSAPRQAYACGVDFVTRSRGYVVGNCFPARFYRTSDAGRTWRRVPTGWDTFGVAFSGPRAGWAWGSDGVLRTDDGGRTWRPQPIAPGDETPSALVAFSPSLAVAAGNAGVYGTATAGGDAPGPSKITLRASRKRVRKGGLVTFAGVLTPRLEGEIIKIVDPGFDGERTVRTGPGGAFRLTTRIRRTADVFARWAGDGVARGAGTRPLRVTVPVKRKRRGR